MKALSSLIMVCAAVLAGVLAWNTLDVALGGPGAAARGLLPVAITLPGHSTFTPASLPSPSPAPAPEETLDGKVARAMHYALVYEANGWLTIFYFIAEHIAAVAALALAAATAFLERDAPASQRVFTVFTLAATVLSALFVPAPIPAILAAMWFFVPLALLLDPVGGKALAWRARSGILLYAGAAVAYILYSRLTAGVSPEAWAALAGGVEEARAVMAQSRAYVATMANIALWFVLPLGYLSLMAQALLAHPLPSAPFRTMAERVRLIRTRGVE